MPSLEEAISLAVEAHRGQRDKAGQPYILHPIRVMMRCRTEAERIAAVLHDVVEDTEWTLERLREEGVPEEVLAALRVEIGRPLWLLFGGSSWSHDGRLLLQKVAWAGTVWKLCGMLLPKVQLFWHTLG